MTILPISLHAYLSEEDFEKIQMELSDLINSI